MSSRGIVTWRKFFSSSVAEERCAQRTDHVSRISCRDCGMTGFGEGRGGEESLTTFWVEGHGRYEQVASAGGVGY
jgi:hypothetical protein